MDKDTPIFVIAGTSGAGKDTLRNLLRERKPGAFFEPLQWTTRPERPSESKPYKHVTEEEFFEAKRSGALLEHARIHGDWYGTASPTDAQRAGRPLLMILNTEGIDTLSALFPKLKAVFLDAPNATLMRRICERDPKIPDHQLETRLGKSAPAERAWADRQPHLLRIETASKSKDQVYAEAARFFGIK